jgi:hypothetical protein
MVDAYRSDSGLRVRPKGGDEPVTHHKWYARSFGQHTTYK